MKSIRKSSFLIIGTFAIVILVIVSKKFIVKEHKRTILGCFDTVCEITAASKSERPLNSCEKYIKEAELEMSAENSQSTIYKYNHGENVNFSPDLKMLLDFSKEFTKSNRDYFSIYLQPLIKAWDIKNNKGVIPDVNSALISVKSENEINLGAVAKGFVTEKLVDILASEGVSSALINLGGNAYAMGKKITGENWKIGIQNPNEKDENSIIGVITAENLAVITSGDYQRYFESDGIKYHHIFDPKTGYPAKNELHSVTVISDNPTLCDALSTAAFVAGLEDGIELLKKYNCSGIFVTDDTVYFSKELENIFKQTNFSYKYEFIY